MALVAGTASPPPPPPCATAGSPVGSGGAAVSPGGCCASAAGPHGCGLRCLRCCPLCSIRFFASPSLKELPGWWCGLASPEVGDGSEGATDASADAGMVTVPVTATMASLACCSSHCTVSPSDLSELRLLPPFPGLRHHLQLLLLLLPSAAPVLLWRLVNLDLQVVLRRLLLLLPGGGAASVPTVSGTFEIRL